MSETQFSAQLREATAVIHDDVEHTDFMVNLMEGRLDAEAYATLLTQYEVIYAALEDRDRMFADDPVFAPFHDPRLERHERIVSDLTALGSGDIAVTEAALDYASRLAAIETPEAMIAHHYTRYLGDLSGGQAIGTLMGRHYGIGDDALTMWDFSDLGKTKPYKDAYRARLDEVAATGGDEQAVTAETLDAFALNGTLLAELTAAREQSVA